MQNSLLDDILDFLDENPINKGQAVSLAAMIFSGIGTFLSFINAGYTAEQQNTAMRLAVRDEVARQTGKTK